MLTFCSHCRNHGLSVVPASTLAKGEPGEIGAVLQRADCISTIDHVDEPGQELASVSTGEHCESTSLLQESNDRCSRIERPMLTIVLAPRRGEEIDAGRRGLLLLCPRRHVAAKRQAGLVCSLVRGGFGSAAGRRAAQVSRQMTHGVMIRDDIRNYGLLMMFVPFCIDMQRPV